MIVAWWSAGVTSAVACKMALEMYKDVQIYYISIDTAHKDNARFKAACEQWYGCTIQELKSAKFDNQFDVIRSTGAVNTPYGAPCTRLLKKDVRLAFERKNSGKIKHQVWGYEYEKRQINRAIRHGRKYAYTSPLFPLIEKGLTKENCALILQKAGIALPQMYRLGYNNNNCIGCVKGGKGYWNKIRVDFPSVFAKMARMERETGYSCINGTFLDELDPSSGRMTKEVMPNCGVICEIPFGDIADKNLKEVLNQDCSIYEAISM